MDASKVSLPNKAQPPRLVPAQAKVYDLLVHIEPAFTSRVIVPPTTDVLCWGARILRAGRRGGFGTKQLAQGHACPANAPAISMIA